VRAALEGLPGMGKVEYDPGREVFTVDYDPARTEVTAIFAAIFLAGKQMGQEYLPRLAE
jgi:hypothetical protein